jgi:hypothetical protein
MEARRSKALEAPFAGRHRRIRAQGPAVHSAKVMDYEGIKVLMGRAKGLFPRLAQLWMDGGYNRRGQGRRLGTQDVRVECGDR